jgi:hypothetical protein
MWRGSPDSFPVKAERDEEGKIRPVWARHVERKKMGGPVMHTLEHWVGGGRQRRIPDGGGRWSGHGRCVGVRHGEKEKKRRVGRACWTADGPAALGRPEVNCSFSDLFK